MAPCFPRLVFIGMRRFVCVGWRAVALEARSGESDHHAYGTNAAFGLREPRRAVSRHRTRSLRQGGGAGGRARSSRRADYRRPDWVLPRSVGADLPTD